MVRYAPARGEGSVGSVDKQDTQNEEVFGLPQCLSMYCGSHLMLLMLSLYCLYYSVAGAPFSQPRVALFEFSIAE